jgi:hypothetical protein
MVMNWFELLVPAWKATTDETTERARRPCWGEGKFVARARENHGGYRTPANWNDAGEHAAVWNQNNGPGAKPGVVLMSNPGTASRGTMPPQTLPDGVIAQLPWPPTFFENAAFMILVAKVASIVEVRNLPDATWRDNAEFPAEYKTLKVGKLDLHAVVFGALHHSTTLLLFLMVAST